MSGFFLITRGITSHHLFEGKPERLAVWMWLLDNVAFKNTTQDAKGKTVPVPRGSVCASLRHIANKTGVGHQVVRTALKRFETEHMVNTTVTHGKTVISLCNYDKHQRSDGSANTTPNTTLTQDQHKPNTQKKQGNKVSKEESTNVLLSDTPPAIDEIAQSVSAYNAAAERTGWPKIQKLSASRRAAIRGRLKDAGGATGWEVALSKAEASRFLRGEVNDFRMTFDWMTKAANFTKLMEGNYDDRSSQNRPAPRDQALADEILAAARAR